MGSLGSIGTLQEWTGGTLAMSDISSGRVDHHPLQPLMPPLLPWTSKMETSHLPKLPENGQHGAGLEEGLEERRRKLGFKGCF